MELQSEVIQLTRSEKRKYKGWTPELLVEVKSGTILGNVKVTKGTKIAVMYNRGYANSKIIGYKFFYQNKPYSLGIKDCKVVGVYK